MMSGLSCGLRRTPLSTARESQKQIPRRPHSGLTRDDNARSVRDKIVHEFQ
jgi:hypothetical protein